MRLLLLRQFGLRYQNLDDCQSKIPKKSIQDRLTKTTVQNTNLRNNQTNTHTSPSTSILSTRKHLLRAILRRQNQYRKQSNKNPLRCPNRLIVSIVGSALIPTPRVEENRNEQESQYEKCILQCWK